MPPLVQFAKQDSISLVLGALVAVRTAEHVMQTVLVGTNVTHALTITVSMVITVKLVVRVNNLV